ncbi:MAG TPA: hypothetical protein DCS44_04700 [Cyanobacteria bacterium UBA10660]|nr:MAG TPA: hypothetical protein CPT83_04950 [Candidatus Gastranaerophilales bacterium HUM_1]HAS93900.1 hypothetical protein [Cyanobacteria bacterium UBA10660]
MKKCYYCGKDLNNQKVKPEHIIPNAVGGRLTSKNILCNDCNNKLAELDQSLSNSVYFLTNLLNPKRDNKTKSNLPIKFKFNNREFVREADGKYYSSQFKIEKTEKGFHLHLNAFYSSDNGAREKAIKPAIKALDSLAQNYKWSAEKINEEKRKLIEAISRKVVDTEDIPTFTGQIALNQDDKLFLSMLKISIGYYLSNEYDINYLNDSINIIKNKDIKLAREHCYYFFPNDFYKEDSIYHSIYLKGDKQNQVLYSLVSIYGCINCIILLNDNYNGDSFEKSYFYDLRNHKEIKFEKSINLTKSEIKNILTTLPENLVENFKNKINLFMSFLTQRKFDGNEVIPVLEECYSKVIKYNFMGQQDYVNNFNAEFVALMKKHQDFKYLYEDQMIEMSKIGMRLYSYNYYLHNFCILRILSKIVASIITDSLIRKQSIKECLNNLKNTLETYKAEIAEIDNILLQNKEKYQNSLISFVEEYYPKFQNNY